MPRLKCPRCATVIEVAAGASPVCPACGFGSAGATTAAPTPIAPPTVPMAAQGWTPPPAAPVGYATPPHAAAAPAQRPGWVTFAAVVEFIVGGFYVLGGLVLLLVGSAFAAFFEEGFGEFGDLLAGLLVVIAIFLVLVGILMVFVGAGLLKGRGWARITAIVLAIAAALFGVLSLVSGDVSAVVGLILDGLVLFALLNPASKAWFDQVARSGHA